MAKTNSKEDDLSWLRGEGHNMNHGGIACLNEALQASKRHHVHDDAGTEPQKERTWLRCWRFFSDT